LEISCETVLVVSVLVWFNTVTVDEGGGVGEKTRRFEIP
jgi:hypothetical protein